MANATALDLTIEGCSLAGNAKPSFFQNGLVDDSQHRLPIPQQCNESAIQRFSCSDKKHIVRIYVQKSATAQRAVRNPFKMGSSSRQNETKEVAAANHMTVSL